MSEKQIIQTDVGAKDGQNKCPSCGATDISTNIKTGLLRCNYCRHEFAAEENTELKTSTSKLTGQVVASGAQNIVASTDDVLTFKCSSCAAEVVIDTSEATQARCHWCRNTLSVNQQIPNGAVPDSVLPFSITKEDAKQEIEKFVGKRKFFAHPKFRQEFLAENVMGVFLPYMIVDINAHANLAGEGEKLIRKYTRGTGSETRTYYDADLYEVEREFDIAIDGLTVESSSDRLDKQASNKTNNIINAIMPFDTAKSVKWNANYLRGFSSERRDTNIDQLDDLVITQAKDVARHKANESLEFYDRGVAWASESLDLKGQRWQAAYLPVWLYSYQQVSGEKKTLHYVAVNARSKKTMGSVPIYMPKLIAISAAVELASITLWWTILVDQDFGWLCILAGFVYFFIIYGKYRNKGARHHHEKDTTSEMSALRKKDKLITRRTGLENSRIAGENSRSVSGAKGISSSVKKGVASVTPNVGGIPVGDLVDKFTKKM